jgi:perosamine synthetase
MIVSSKVFPRFCSMFKNRSENGLFELSDIHFFKLGRDALLVGLRALHLVEGDIIIVPAYMCESTIRPLRSFGYELIFVDVDENLNIPLSNIESIIKNCNVKAILVVNYFGFTVNIDALVSFCHKYNVKVIEDCSHSFMSQLLRDPVDIKSDMEIFSMRKGLPVQDGGALRINIEHGNAVASDDNSCISNVSTVFYLFIRLIERVASILRVDLYGERITKIKGNIRRSRDVSNNDMVLYQCKPSFFLECYLSDASYLNMTINRIRNNFIKLSDMTAKIGIKPLYGNVPSKCVPQAYLIYDDKGGLVDYLRNNGVGAWQWPASELPDEIRKSPNVYPNSILLDKYLVLLPVHQSITNRNCSYMFKVLSKWQCMARL